MLFFLNEGASKLDVSSLGRIPKKNQPSSKKHKKAAKTNKNDETEDRKKSSGKCELEDKPESSQETEGKMHKKSPKHMNSGDDIYPPVIKQETVEPKTKTVGSEVDKFPQDHNSNDDTELPPDRGHLAFNDDILPRIDSTKNYLNMFMPDDAKTAKSAETSPDQEKDALFTEVMQRRPTTGTIPGLGDLENIPKQQKTKIQVKDSSWGVYTKRQVLKSGSGLKCVLSGYNPVSKRCDPAKADIMESLSAALHWYV